MTEASIALITSQLQMGGVGFGGSSSRSWEWLPAKDAKGREKMEKKCVRDSFFRMFSTASVWVSAIPPFHGSWLNMIEIWFGILGLKSLKDGDFDAVAELIAHIEAFLETWNTSYAHPFTWTYQGHGLHDKIVERFNRVLEAENPEMECCYLRKQLELLSNLINNYRHEVSVKAWKRLQELAIEKRSYLENIISNESKPRTKSWAQEAMARFTENLESISAAD